MSIKNCISPSSNRKVSQHSTTSPGASTLHFLCSRKDKFHENETNMTKATLRDAWPRHSRSNTSKITDKIGLKYCKLTFFMDM